ncbi:PRTRC system protein E [Paraburkholderia sp. BL21I4N1]|uniref:PRTRC system protein E n=1 Tax=Paraburkholderia sp. BL21I4N1 TaxID=1938801 RepID=UPI000CFD7757|nr:PRTRC system protein E [Paraburkholderia sp. BL21I4N1]PQV51009.1 PRTRC genetic system protein E [Paraburkholderia sp. BL21I4N1]
MSLFTSLQPLAKLATLTLLITAEGDQLRVNVTPRASDDDKGEKTLYPLSILATAEELDRDFAEAVSIYEPSTLSVLDQARAASAANGAGSAPKALPAPSTKGKPGRKRASEVPAPSDSSENPGGGEAPEADPRQTQIPGIEPGAEQATPETPAAAVEQDSSNDQQAADDGVDLL